MKEGACLLQVHLLSVGKIKEAYLRTGIAEYEKRLQPYLKLKTIELTAESADATNPALIEILKDREGERILAALPIDTYFIALDYRGRSLDSLQFAQHLADISVNGTSRIAFAIGGSWGLAQKVLERADLRLSFGRMTFPHQLMRLIFLEQLYRAMKINRGEQYHK